MNHLRFFLIAAAATGCACALPEGFIIRDFAGPPDADYPAAITAAPNGDVYVSSDQNASLGRDKNMGRVIRCRDKDGDGKADEFVHFIPDVNSPRGGHFVGDTLYLIHPPFLSSFRDTNGDGIADEKKVLVTGLGGGIEHPRGADHTTNGVRMGIDGWLYISVGDFGTFPAKGTDGSTYTLHGGGVIRVRPDGSHVEPYALMVRNICDTAISPELDLFSRDNTNDGKGWNTRFHHFTALGDHGYPRLYQNFSGEAVKPLADYGGGSGTGALWLSEPGFPAEFTDALFSCDWTTGNIHYHPWKRVGASFAVEQKTFEKLPRAIDIDVDGNSRLYLADWRGGGFKFSGPNKPVGMIQQVVYPGLPAAKYIDVTKANDAALLKLLTSASAVQRLETQREILKRGRKPEFAKGVFAIARDSGQTIAVRTAAIFTYKQLYGKEGGKYLAELVSDATVREQALRALADLCCEFDGIPVKPFADALTDKNPRVVLQALVGLQKLKSKDSAPAIFSASGGWNEEGDSPRLQHTAMQVLASLGNIPACLTAAGQKSNRTLALLALERIHTMVSVDGLIALLEKTADPEARFDILKALARLSYKEKEWDMKSWWNTRPDDRGPYYQPAEWEATAKIRPVLEKGYAMIAPEQQSAYLEELAKNRVPVSELKLAGLDPVLAALALSKPDDAQVKILADAAKSAERPFAQRLKCYKALSRAAEKQVMPLQLAVLAAWSEQADAPAEVTMHISDFVNDTRRGGQVKELRAIAAAQRDSVSRIAWKSMITVMNSPLAKPQWKDAVRSHLKETPREVGFFLAIADLKAAGFEKQIEEAMNWDNTQLIEAAKLAKAAVSASGHDGRKVAELAPEDVMKTAMSGKGDPAAGARLYTSQGCIACHSIDPDAEQKGPYLGAAGAKFTRDYLIESILDPNKVVAQGFQTSILKLKDGTVKMGFITREEDGLVEVRDIAGQVSQVKRADVTEETHLPNSMMPPGLGGTLTVGEFTSLIEYLVSLKAKGG